MFDRFVRLALKKLKNLGQFCREITFFPLVIITGAAVRGCFIKKVFYKKGVLKDFTKSTGKCLCQSLLFNKVAGLRQHLYIAPPYDCFWCHEVSFRAKPKTNLHFTRKFFEKKQAFLFQFIWWITLSKRLSSLIWDNRLYW